jgi:general secretion pathway protein H
MKAIHPRQQGFHLIELLVVMAIAGIMLTFAVLGVGSTAHHRVRNEAEQLQLMIAQLRQEAILKNLQYAVRIRADGYEVLTINEENEWQVLKEDKLYKPHPLDDDLEFIIDLDQASDNGEDQGSLIYILSSGEISPFQLTVQSTDKVNRIQLQGDMLGHTEITTPGSGDEEQ